MGRLLQDIRYGIRMLVKNPAFTAVAVLTLALGIGANVAIFTVVNAVLLHPLPFPQPSQLVRVTADANGTGGRNIGLSEPELDDLRQRSDLFDDVSAIWPISASLLGGERPERIEILATSTGYFHLLGANPQIGRVYGSQDATPGFSDAVVISDGLWRRQFGASGDILGRKVIMDTDTYTIVGVMPPDFRHPGETVQGDVDMWSACGFTGSPFVNPPQRTQNFIPGVIGRLKPDISIEQARSRLGALTTQLRSTYPTNYPAAVQWTLRLDPVQQNLTARVRPILSVLLVAVGFVLIIACANIANLLLARSSGRTQEIAVRRALGASRGQIIRQLLTESLLLSIAGGTAALLVLDWLKGWLVRMIPADLPRISEIHFDARIIGTGFVLSVVTGLLFGAIPAIQVSAINPGENLKEAGRWSGGGLHQARVRGALVAAEIAISLVLLIGAGLLVRSFWGMLHVNPGLDIGNVGFAQIWIPVPNDPTKNPYATVAQRSTLVSDVLSRVSELPGVESAAMGNSSRVPFGGTGVTQRFVFAGESTAASDVRRAEFQVASPEYFTALKSPILSGRAFSVSDAEKSEKVVIVNETLVRTYSRGKNPVGRSISLLGQTQPSRIVGVVGDIHDDGLDVPVPARVYFPIYQRSGNSLTLYYRSSADPRGLNTNVEQAIHSVDPTLPVFGQRTLQNLMADSEVRRKFVLFLMGAFAVVALLLAALGTYGVMSFAANQRIREVGIRIALGAQRRDIIYLMIGPGLKIAFAGVAVGVVSAFILTRLMGTLLFEVAPTDIITYASLSVLLSLVTIVACVVPARRATRVDPMVALRHE
ncbi:MAG: ABC transporter permease [Candidatus Acidiferrales bacterium]